MTTTIPRPSSSAAVATAAFAVAAIASLAVGGALVFEHVFGYVPCMLCLWERWPYYLGAPLALVAGVLALGGRSGLAKPLLAVAGALFLGNALLGAYHAGVEWSFWPGPASCAGANAAPTAAGGLLEQMRATRIVPCDAAAWRLFGISLAGYSALISAAVAGLAAYGLTRR
ncbi:disulfide bond formation protein B [Hansschlegelia sp. KR7-227]|uniref:disulfide bond formation protein B n=1 Tax=Hansschlegelia sp. KR7-227 TaxID=3400914 RepID=UPI003C04F5C0